MARRGKGLGSTGCRLPTGASPEPRCVTEGKVTFCVGDRVTRRDIKVKLNGTVLGFKPSSTNSGAKKKGAVVCWDIDEPNQLAYGFLFSEIKPVKR